MGKDRLDEYRRKRQAGRTTEPVPPEGAAAETPGANRGHGDTFVIQEHHARRLHWDLRLERDGVLVSWALPRGVPLDPARDHLAVHTEDHPLEYATFEGEIPRGEYGAGAMSIWDGGRYETEKWRPNEVMVVLHGARASGRYVLFQTDGDSWMIHRMDPPPPGWAPLPRLVRPMLATPGALPPPADQDRFGFEMKWDGVRAIAYVEGGRVRLLSRNYREIAATYPEVQGLGTTLGSTQCVLDGELVAFDDLGRASFGALQRRMHLTTPAEIRRIRRSVPVTYLVFDLLHLEGRSTAALPYSERRALLEGLELAGSHWQTPPYFPGAGAAVLETSREQGLEGVVAKRLDAPYEPGSRSRSWVKVKSVRTQDVVVVGWRPGVGRRASTVGALLLAVHTAEGLSYVGRVGSGFTEGLLDDLKARLQRIERATSPLHGPVPEAEAGDVHWVRPRYVAEVAFAHWTRDGRLRHPVWRGLRPDRDPADVRPESS
ncbi:MAG: non-homologous end-joining DNA ligase [Carbonactinosporaceae bacterium]